MPDFVFTRELLDSGVKSEHLRGIRDWGYHLAEDRVGISTTQLRRFFGAVRRIQASFDELKGEIILLEPKIAYSVGRSRRDNRINDFYNKICKPLIVEIKEDKKRFQHFAQILEVIVAYHKEKSKI